MDEKTNDRVFLPAQFDHGHVASYVDGISSIFNAFSSQPWWQGQLSETHTFGPAAANQFLIAGNYIHSTNGVTDPSERPGCSSSDPKLVQCRPAILGSRGLGLPICNPSIVENDWSEGGGNFSNTPQLLPQTIDAFFFGGVDPSSPNTDYTSILRSFPADSRHDFWFYSLGLYGQDEWHARSNLTFSAAMRADHQSNPVCDDGCFARLPKPWNTINHDPSVPYNQTILIGH